MNVIWFSGSKVIVLISRIILLMWISRRLSSEDFGLFHVFNILYGFIILLPNVGLGSSLIQRKEVNKNHIQTSFSVTIIFSIFISIILYFFRSYLAILFNAPDLQLVLTYVFWFPTLIMIMTISRSLLLKNMEIKKISMIELTSYVFIYIPGVIIAYYFEPNYRALIYPFLAQMIYESAIYFFFTKNHFALSISFKSLKELLSFGGFNSLNSITTMIGNQSDGIIISRFLGISSLGLYNRGFSLVSVIQNLYAQYLDRISFAEFSSLKDNQKLHIEILRKTEYILYLLLFPMLLICLASTKEIIIIVLGEKWLNVELIIQILLISIVFRLNFKIFLQYLKSQGHIVNILLYNVSYLIFMIITMSLLSIYGLTGITLGFLIGQIFRYFIFYIKMRSVINLFSFKKILIRNKTLFVKFFLSLIVLFLFQYLCFDFKYVVSFIIKSSFVLIMFYKELIIEFRKVFFKNKFNE